MGTVDGSLEWPARSEETQAIFGGVVSQVPDPQAGASIFTALESSSG